MRILLFLLTLVLLACNSKPVIIHKTTSGFSKGQLSIIEMDLPEHKGDTWSVTTEDFPESGTPLQKTDPGKWYFIAPVNIAAGSELIIRREENEALIPCEIIQDADFITAKIGDQEILKYAIATQFPADTLPAYYQRSGFIHPLKTLSGETLTAGFPHGHVHQHGIFHAWTRSHVRDSMIDFWNQQARLGDIRHKEVLAIRNGPVYSSFSVALEYLAYIDGDTLVVSDEIWDIRLIPMGDHYLVDWQLQQKCLGPETLVIDEYHYGGAAFRGCEVWNLEGGAYDSLVYLETSEGKSQIDGNHTRPEWVTMHGYTSGGYGGITMFQDPENLRYPQPVRIHPTMPYFCFAPMVLGSFTLLPGDLYRARYRLLVFDGKPNRDLIRRYASDGLR